MSNLPASFGLICGGFFFLIALAAGVALLVSSEKSKKKAGASQGWPAVPGTIMVSEVRESRSTDEDGHTSIAYYPRVEYSYTVNGAAFTGKQISFGGTLGNSNPSMAQGVIARYPANSPVTVYYNPEKPGDAVLERVLGKAGNATKIIGIILIVISVMIACPLLIGVFRNF
jgi:hypothetical protein